MNALTFNSGGYQRILIYLLAVLGLAVVVGANLYPDSPFGLGRLVLFGGLFGFILGGNFDYLRDAKLASKSPWANRVFCLIAFAVLFKGWNLHALSSLVSALLYVGALIAAFLCGRRRTSSLKALMASSKYE